MRGSGSAVAADSACGDQDGFRAELAEAGLLFVMALKAAPRDLGLRAGCAHPVDPTRALAWDGPDDPGDWQAVTRTFRDGHTETWQAADAVLGWWGPDGARRLRRPPPTLPPCRTRPPLVPGHQPLHPELTNYRQLDAEKQDTNRKLSNKNSIM